MTEERVITLALTPEEARLVSVMFAFGAAVLYQDALGVVATGTLAKEMLCRLPAETQNALCMKLINLHVETSEGDERVITEAARRLALGGEG